MYKETLGYFSLLTVEGKTKIYQHKTWKQPYQKILNFVIVDWIRETKQPLQRLYALELKLGTSYWKTRKK